MKLETPKEENVVPIRGVSRDFEKGGTLFQPPWLANDEILGFRWSKKAKITLEIKSFGETFLPVFSNFLHFYT